MCMHVFVVYLKLGLDEKKNPAISTRVKIDERMYMGTRAIGYLLCELLKSPHTQIFANLMRSFPGHEYIMMWRTSALSRESAHTFSPHFQVGMIPAHYSDIAVTISSIRIAWTKLHITVDLVVSIVIISLFTPFVSLWFDSGLTH